MQKITAWFKGLEKAEQNRIESEFRTRLGRNPSPIDYYRKDPTVIKGAHPVTKKVIYELTKLKTRRDFKQMGPQITAKALKLSRRFDLLITDSYILATAIVNKIPDIVTTDIRDFGRVANPLNINIYVPPKLLPSD